MFNHRHPFLFGAKERVPMKKDRLLFLIASFCFIGLGALRDTHIPKFVSPIFRSSGDVAIWQWRFAQLSINPDILLLTMAMIVCFGIPIITQKIYKIIYEKEMPTLVFYAYIFLFVFSPYNVLLPYGYYAQITAIFFSLIVFYQLISKQWTWAALYAIPLVLAHSTGIVMLGILLSTVLVKEKKYALGVTILLLFAVISSINILPRDTYSVHLLSPTDAKEWTLTATPLSYFGIGSINRFDQEKLSFFVILLAMELMAIFSKNRPIYINYIIGCYLALVLFCIIGNPEIVRISYVFYAYYPLFLADAWNIRKSVKNYIKTN